MSALEAYLAKNYSSKKDKKKKAKKSKKGSEEFTPDVVQDDQEMISEDENNEGPVIIQKKSASKGTWKVLGDPEDQLNTPARPAPDISTASATGISEKTVYRDMTGRIITDLNELNSKIPKTKQDLAKEKASKLKQINKPDIPINESTLPTRVQSTAEIDKEAKENIKDDDPALLFDKNIIQNHQRKLGKYVSETGRKLYVGTGHFENRFGIKPGKRWDGINRGNAFEMKWFDKQIDSRERKVLEYTLAEDGDGDDDD